MEKIYILNCPNCLHALPQAFKKKEVLDTTRVKCSECEHEDLGNQFTVKETTKEEWIGVQYRETPGITAEQFQQMYEQEINSGRVPLDEILKGQEPQDDNDDAK